MKNDPNEIVIYESSDGAVRLPIRVDYGENTVWLNRAQIAELFKREKILDMLRDDYEDLHGMSLEYLMQFIDRYLGGDLTW